jgi:hypothetical protein
MSTGLWLNLTPEESLNKKSDDQGQHLPATEVK